MQYRSRRLLSMVLVVVSVGGACAGESSSIAPSMSASAAVATLPATPLAPPQMTDRGTASSSDAVPSTPGGSPAPSTTAPPTAAAASDAWLRAPLVDARSGHPFTLAELSRDRVVYVQAMAQWCTNCRAQQEDAKTVLERLGDRAAWVTLDIEGSEPESVRRYAQRYGFDWRFAVPERDVVRALAEEFGDSVLNPPLTPLIVLRPGGSFERLHDGHKSVEELVALAG